jgi:hypothetical protein
MSVRLWFSPGFLSLSRYIAKKLALARNGLLKPSDFDPIPDHAEEFRVKRNRDLWIEHRPTSFAAACRMYKGEFLVPFLVGSLQWALGLFGSFFFFQALSNVLTDPTQKSGYGWVIVVFMFVCLALANLFQVQ